MFPIRSWSRYGRKSGKAGNAESSLLGRQCSRSSLRAGATPVEIASALARLMQRLWVSVVREPGCPTPQNEYFNEN